VLRVGPESAGSTPGPACYGRGGARATITDAMVVLGWLGHSDMAYGQLRMDAALAREAVGRIAARLGRTLEATAQAIVDIAVSELFVEVEKLASRAGVDLRDFTLMPFGGGGPMLGAFLARELRMKRMMAARRPGVVSALGGLVADMRGDFIRTLFAELSDDLMPGLRTAFADMAREGRNWLAAQGHAGPVELRAFADMRYAGQSYEIETPLRAQWLEAGDRNAIAREFHATHARLYDFDDPQGRIEIVNLRVSAIGAGPALSFPEQAPVAARAVAGRGVDVYLRGETARVPLYTRADLQAGGAFEGPAVVAQEDTTLAIPPGVGAHVDSHLNLHLTFGD
jgi:N-methylhydantoinase A